VKNRTPATDALDEQLRKLLGSWDSVASASQLVSLGRPALERVLQAVERSVSLVAPGATSELDGRAYEDGLQAAIAAFAAQDMEGVLAQFEARGWSALQRAHSGVARLAHPHVVPLLVAALADKEPTTRLFAVNALGAQRDPRATQALVAALTDRSSQVRTAAVAALGEAGDPDAVAPLQALAARPSRSTLLADRAREAIRKLKGRRSPRAR
jgi:HEAT repeat protein